MLRYVDKSKGHLFSTHDLGAVIQNQIAGMQKEIESLDQNRLLNTAPADLTDYLVRKYCLEPVSLLRDQWYATEQETQVDVRYDPH